MFTLTKKTFATMLANRFDYTKTESANLTDWLVHSLIVAIRNRKVIYIPNLYRIGSVVKNERMGRNLKTGENVVITKRYAVTARTVKGFDTSNRQKFLKSDFIEIMKVHVATTGRATKIVNMFYEFLSSIKDPQYRIEIRGLGTFYSIKSDRTIYHNVKTGEKVENHNVVRLMFKCSKSNTEYLNEVYL